jgi:putative addiction module killer protein
MRVEKTAEFQKWFKSADNTTRIRVAARLLKVEAHSHLGKFKNLDQGLCELKWSIGLRVYFVIATDEQGNLFVALLGGGKNGQSRDISKARTILERYRTD